MTITKCDICKKEIKEDSGRVYANHRWPLSGHVFCLSCGKPVYSFLKKHGFIKDDER